MLEGALQVARGVAPKLQRSDIQRLVSFLAALKPLKESPRPQSCCNRIVNDRTIDNDPWTDAERECHVAIRQPQHVQSTGRDAKSAIKAKPANTTEARRCIIAEIHHVNTLDSYEVTFRCSLSAGGPSWFVKDGTGLTSGIRTRKRNFDVPSRTMRAMN